MTTATLAVIGGAMVLAAGYLLNSAPVVIVGAVPFTLGACREAADRLGGS